MYILPAFKYTTDKFCVIISFPKPKYYICEASEHSTKNRTHTQSHTCSPILARAIRVNFQSKNETINVPLLFIRCILDNIFVLHYVSIEATEATKATTEIQVQV